MMSNSPGFQNVALLFLRLVIGAVFLYVGFYSKLMFWTGPAPEGMPAGMVLLMQFLCIVELIGGLAVILGFLTRWAALGLGIIMVGAVGFIKLMMHGTWFTGVTGSGADYVILILAGCLVLMAFGAGAWSVDAKMLKKM